MFETPNILHLDAQITQLKEALAEEKAKTRKNEEKIQVMEEQLDDLLETLRTVQVA